MFGTVIGGNAAWLSLRNEVIMTNTVKKRDYILFAICAIICYLVFRQEDISHMDGGSFSYLQRHILTIWNILSTLFYLGSAILMYKISRQIGMGQGKSKLCMYAFLTTPIGFCSQFLIGQYGSAAVFFMLLGIYYYLKDNRALFVLLFALSLPLNYFPFFVFLPMLLLKEKVIWKIFRDTVPMAILYGLVFTSTDHVYSASFPIGSTDLSLVICVFCLICVWAYFKHVTGKLLEAQWVCFLSSLSCVAIFGLSQWHPQWLLFAVPFWVLGAFLHRNTKAFWTIDVLMMLFFCIFQCSVYPIKNMNLVGTIFTALMLVSVIFKYPPTAQANLIQEIPNAMRALWARYLVGISIFIVPVVACYLI